MQKRQSLLVLQKLVDILLSIKIAIAERGYVELSGGLRGDQHNEVVAENIEQI